jgi:hypothetical protein
MRLPKVGTPEAENGVATEAAKSATSTEVNGAPSGKAAEPASSIPLVRESPIPERNPWQSFAQGSRIVWLGMLTELVSLTIPLLLGATGEGWSGVRLVVLVSCACLLVLGAGLVALGRSWQADVPESDAAPALGALPWISFVLGWGQFLALLAGVSLLLSTALFLPPSSPESRNTPRVANREGGESSWWGMERNRITNMGTEREMYNAPTLILVAVFARWFADIAAIVALALISGRMRGKLLGQRVVSVCAVFLCLGMLYLGLFLYLRIIGAVDLLTGSARWTESGVLLAIVAIPWIYLLLNMWLNIGASESTRGELSQSVA